MEQNVLCSFYLFLHTTSFYQNETDTERLFDSIIVVTDRRILDKQLQDTIKQFEQTTGVVNPIDMNSAQLKQALETGKDIIITTLQKFPVISASMTDLKGKTFAVIVDEAHSSQSGEASKHLKKTGYAVPYSSAPVSEILQAVYPTEASSVKNNSRKL